MSRLAILMVLATGCLPEVEVDLARVDEPRVLAVRAEPAEVAPGEVATLTALYADASGELAAAPLSWALCTARRPLAELGPVNKLCLADDGDALTPVGEGLEVLAAPPVDACRRFGPEPPTAEPGQPTGRVVDPDRTGGYYQPLRIVPDGETSDLTLVQLRLRCGLAGATQQQASEYRQRYKPNAAPAVLAVTADDKAVAGPLGVAPGDELALQVRWAACPDQASCGDGLCSLDESIESCAEDCTDNPGCAGAENYLHFDPATLTLATRREAIGVAWYTTGGSFAQARTGRAPEEQEASSDNVWTAPEEAGAHTLWVVLRDDRGATGWSRIDVQVE